MQTIANDYAGPDDCQKHDRSTSRAPSDHCAQCWKKYNYERDLPLDNRTPVSNLKKDGLRWSRFVPELKNGYVGRTKSKRRAILEHVDDPSLKPVSLGVDISLSSTGIALIALDESGDWLCFTATVGYSLSQDASYEVRTKRLVDIVTKVNQVYRTCDPTPGVYMEDHAYSKHGGAFSNEKSELHGAIRTQIYAQGTLPGRIGTTTRLKSVHRNGKTSIDKKDISEFWEETYGWSEDLNDDELDALLVGLTPIREALYTLRYRSPVTFEELHSEVKHA